MTASDHLNGQQFMSVAEIGSMPSQWTEGWDADKWRNTGRTLTNEEAYHQPADRLGPRADDRAANFGFDSGRAYQDHITSDIAANGIQTPLALAKPRMPGQQPYLSNGHHRWMAARELGMDQVPVKYV